MWCSWHGCLGSHLVQVQLCHSLPHLAWHPQSPPQQCNVEPCMPTGRRGLSGLGMWQQCTSVGRRPCPALLTLFTGLMPHPGESHGRRSPSLPQGDIPGYTASLASLGPWLKGLPRVRARGRQVPPSQGQSPQVTDHRLQVTGHSGRQGCPYNITVLIWGCLVGP